LSSACFGRDQVQVRNAVDAFGQESSYASEVAARVTDQVTRSRRPQTRRRRPQQLKGVTRTSSGDVTSLAAPSRFDSGQITCLGAAGDIKK
jgi:hypothetical protein